MATEELTSKDVFPKEGNPHREHLVAKFRKCAEDLLAGTITSDQFAHEQADEQLRLEAGTGKDKPTGLWGIERFGEETAEGIAWLRRTGEPMAFLALDVDDLRGFNNAHKHLAGDTLLRDVYAWAMKYFTRETDIGGRLGGDEFAILLIGTDLEHATVIAERIRTGVTAKFKEIFPDIKKEQTISIGIASARMDDTADILRGRADWALYQAKRDRNKLVIAEPYVECAIHGGQVPTEGSLRISDRAETKKAISGGAVAREELVGEDWVLGDCPICETGTTKTVKLRIRSQEELQE